MLTSPGAEAWDAEAPWLSWPPILRSFFGSEEIWARSDAAGMRRQRRASSPHALETGPAAGDEGEQEVQNNRLLRVCGKLSRPGFRSKHMTDCAQPATLPANAPVPSLTFGRDC